MSPDSSSLPAATVGAAAAAVASVTLDGGKRKKFTIGDVFNQDDDDSMEPKKRKLVPLDYDEDKTSAATSPTEKKAATAEEKRQKIKQLIDSIPTGKDELYAFTVDWDIVDQVWLISTCCCLEPRFTLNCVCPLLEQSVQINQKR